MNKTIVALLLSFLLASCASPDAPENTATPTPITSGFVGPVLGGDPFGQSSSCSEESGCGIANDVPVDVDDAPLLLVQRQAGPFNVGIPEGYSAIVLEDEVLIRADSPDALGGFTVSLRVVNNQSLADTLARLGDLDFANSVSLEHESMTVSTLTTGDYGAIALLQASDGTQIFVQAYAAGAGYWAAFRATFEEVLISIKPVDAS